MKTKYHSTSQIDEWDIPVPADSLAAVFNYFTRYFRITQAIFNILDQAYENNFCQY